MARGKTNEKTEKPPANAVRLDLDPKSPLLWTALGISFGLPTVLYLTGVISEAVAGAVLFTGFVLMLNALALRAIWNASRDRLPRVVGSALLLGMTALSLEPGLTTVYPGRPLAAGSLRNVGESIPLPSDLDGRVRMLLHGDLGQRPQASVDVVLSAGETDIKGHLARTISRGRRGRFRGGASVVEQSSEYLSAQLPKGAGSLALTNVDGSLPEVLEVKVFREWVPVGMLVALGLALLISMAFLSARLRVDSTPTTLSSMAVASGLILYASATPYSAVTPEIGVLFLTVVVGMVLGTVLSWMGRRFASPKV